jgi:thioredoxin-like negative regulator of GroEL
VDEIETATMAELYASQGHFDRAVAVYRNLLARNPNETQYRDRIEELEMLANAAALPETAVPRALSLEAVGDGLTDESRTKTIGVLSSWLEAIRKSREA